MKAAFTALCLLFLTCGTAVANEPPFPVGEELIYSISWIGVPMAWARVTTRMDTLDGRDVLALRMEARTYSFFEHIFKVEDMYETMVDPVTLLPIQHTEDIREKNYRRKDITTFDFQTLEAHYRRLTDGEEKRYPIEADTRDIISFMYFMRAVQLEENSVRNCRVLTDRKIYDLILTAFGLEPIRLPHYDREVVSLKIKPEAMFDGLFVRKGKATVWISRDSRHLLTLARLSTPFGRVSVTLQGVSGPGSDFWITERKNGDDEKSKEQQGDRGDSGALGLDPAAGQAAGDDRR